MAKFPETLYVQMEQDPEDVFPIAHEDMDFSDNGDPVAVYKLVSAGRVERTFVPAKS